MSRRALLASGSALCATACGRTASNRKPVATEVMAPAARSDGRCHVYVGCYTGPDGGAGIHHLVFDPATAALQPVGVTTGIENPSFLVMHPNGRYLYAASEVKTFESQLSGAVFAYAIDPVSGELTPRDHQLSGGAGPCHVSVTADGRVLLVANYHGGSVAALPIAFDGGLGAPLNVVRHEGRSVNAKRQEAPHAHGIYPSPGGRFVLAVDLGIDRVIVYRLDPRSGLVEPSFADGLVSSGAGPRHLAFHPGGEHAFIINELTNTMQALRWDEATAELTSTDVQPTLPPEWKPAKGRGNTTAEVAVSPDGLFVYGSNRGHDSLVVFGFDAGTGRLSAPRHFATGGKTPRHFALSPGGRFVLASHQDSDNVAVLERDAGHGGVVPRGTGAEVKKAVCAIFGNPA